MANWREVDEGDLAATISQGEIDAYRHQGPSDGSDPVARLLLSTVETVRGYISCNGAVRMGPARTLPNSLVIPAMDYAAGKLLNRIDSPLSEDRRNALRRAEELFEKIACSAMTPESYSEDELVDDDRRAATSPAFAPASPARLLD
ncbi:MAG: hypothetical protein K6G91_06430 [Kiritimatiellae bacterium]|nr:hypothetical protein [Kiritimatiellia bacterium]